MWRQLFLLVVSACLINCLPFLTTQDKDAFKETFAAILSGAPDDLASLHHAISGMKLLNQKIDEKTSQRACAHAQNTVDQTDVTSVYHASSIAAELTGCKIAIPKAHEVLAGVFVLETPATQDVYYAAAATVHLGLKLDQTGSSTALSAALKKDDTPAGMGYAFHAALHLEKQNLDTIFSRVEDLIGQADDVDNGKYLQFDGGLSVTAIATSGIYLLADKVGKAPAIKADEAVKLTNYLLSRKGVRLVRPATHLLRALSVLTKNKFHKPVSITLASPVSVSLSDPSVRVRACDVLGETVGALTVTIDAAEHVPTRATVISKQTMKSVPGDNSGLYEFTMLDQSTKRERGFYKMTVSANSQTDKRLIGGLGVDIFVKVMTLVQVDDVELAAFDREQTTTGNIHKPKPPTKMSTVIEADHHQKITMKFSVREKAGGNPIKVHQAFVVFTHQKTKQEIVFVAEPEAGSSVYKFDVDLQKSSKDFDNLSGRYTMRLIVGDAVVANPIDWTVADVQLKFREPETAREGSESISAYKTKPEIKHMFREPEKRPPSFVSDVFTGLCLSPIIIMLIMWLRVGINFGNMPVSLFTLGFHVGLAGIFCLYAMFWLQLNMFTTLKYLSGIGGLTFLCANRMLRIMAERRKTKTE